MTSLPGIAIRPSGLGLDGSYALGRCLLGQGCCSWSREVDCHLNNGPFCYSILSCCLTFRLGCYNYELGEYTAAIPKKEYSFLPKLAV
jgi:hypothetical protein